MRRTFHVLTEAEPFSEYHGGAISRWAANVLRSDTDSVVLAPSADGSWAFPKDRVRIVKGLSSYKRLNQSAGRLLSWSIRTAILRAILAPAMSEIGPGDTVWVHNRPEFAAALSPWLRRRGAKLVLVLHNSHLVEWPEPIVRTVRADRYIFVSRFLQQQALLRFPDLGRTEVLHGGADDTIFYPSPHPKPPTQLPIALFAGRLVPDKGLHIFIEAMYLLHTRQVPLQGIVLGAAGFGDTPPTPYLTEMQWRAAPNTQFLPYCSGTALGDRFREADIFCMPSCWHEPLGLVALEAMATALPVVASRSGGLSEILATGGGILVARRSASELAEALELLATDPGLRRRLSAEAYVSFQRNFTWNTVRQNYHAILDAVQPDAAEAPAPLENRTAGGQPYAANP